MRARRSGRQSLGFRRKRLETGRERRIEVHLRHEKVTRVGTEQIDAAGIGRFDESLLKPFAVATSLGEAAREDDRAADAGLTALFDDVRNSAAGTQSNARSGLLSRSVTDDANS